ncbi:MAG TPA: hydroxymethylbilane synthase [Solirubrobacteraceae bacterium]|nr:hydroxymethylbilane synthase [Solirubrobacteraceae bacterium]
MRLGTRASPLALAQAKLVADLLGGAEIVPITTSGDRGPEADGSLDRLKTPESGTNTLGGTGTVGGTGTDSGTSTVVRASADGDKSRWIDTLEQALLAGEIDIAVHSAKDLPGELSAGLELLGGPARAPAEDVLCGASSLDALRAGARIGTSSLRRAAQLRAAREDVEIVALAGNVDTRLRKLAEDGLDAIVLARAGLQRLGREQEIGAVLDPMRFVPAPGQGMLALQARAFDGRVRDATAGLIDREASECLRAERALAGALGASCDTPLGAYAAPAGCGCLLLRAWIGLPDGSAWIADELLGGFYDAQALGARVAERMRAAGADELLADLGRAPSQPARA